MKAAEKIETEHDRVIKNLVVGRDFLVTGLMVDEPKVAVIPDLKILARKGGRIAQKNIEESFKRGDLASYIETIRQVEATQHKQMEETITKLRLEREAEVKAPKIPKEAQQEIEKLKSSHEKIKKRYEEAMERASVHVKEKYEGRVKELEAELERLTKQLTLKGVQAETVWDHPLVQKRLSDKLTDQQRNLVQFIEKAGPSGPEKIAAFLGCAPKTVPGYISKINKSISNLIDSQSGTYYSRLSQVFPVTEAAKRESEELKRLRDELAHLTKERDDLQQKISAVKKESDGASQSVVKIQKLEGDVRERESRIAQLTRDLAESNNKSREMGRAYSQLKGELEEFNEKLKAYENLQSAIQTITGKVDRDQIHKIAVDEVRRAATEIKGDKNTESIGEDRVRELIRREMAELPTPQATGILSPQSMEALETKIISEVMSRVSSSPNVVVVQPKDALLKDVLKREVEIVKGAVEQLPDKSKLMLGFLASSDKAVSIQELMTRFAGSDGGEQRRKYVDPIRALDTVVKYDKGHGKLTYIWRDTLKSAYPSLTDEELNAAISQVYHILSQKITVRDSP